MNQTPPAAAKLTLKIERDLGTLKNNITRRVLGKVTDGPPEFVGLNVVALVYDPLYIPLSSLPLLWPKQLSEKREPESDSEAEAAQDDSKRKDYFPRPDPNVSPRIQNVIINKVSVIGRSFKSRAEYAKDFFMKEASCYRKLQKYQGTIIPVCLGIYTLSFRDRELEEDRTVHVLLCLGFHGRRRAVGQDEFKPDKRDENSTYTTAGFGYTVYSPQ
jgi:hypothetical protein